MSRRFAQLFLASMLLALLSVAICACLSIESYAQVSQDQAAVLTPTFLPPVTYNTGGVDPLFLADPQWTTLADVNNDGKMDVVVANWCATPISNLTCTSESNVAVFLGNGDGTFKPVKTYPTGNFYATVVRTIDVNGDGKLDLLVAHGFLINVSAFWPDEGSVGVLLGNGDGTFRPVKNYSSGGLLTWMTAADLNHDGIIDLVVTNQDPANNGQSSVGVLMGNGDGTFAPVELYDTKGHLADYVEVADVNSDGKVDLLVSNFYSCQNCQGALGVLLGRGDGTFDPVQNYPAVVGINILIPTDLNGDGKLDVVANAGGPTDGGTIAVLMGNGDGSFQPRVLYGAGAYNGSIIVLDVNGDHKLDLAVASLPGIGVLLGNGDGTFQPLVSYSLPSATGQWSLASGDVNGDGKVDLISASQCTTKPTGDCFGNGRIGIALGNGDGTFQPAFTLDSGASKTAWVGTTDLNRDGKLDIVAVSAIDGNAKTIGKVSVLMNTSVALPVTTTTISSSLNPSNFGESVTFTAIVSASSGLPSGTVAFYDGVNLLGKVSLSGGSASLTSVALIPGTHVISASYEGSASFAASESTGLNQTVNRLGTVSSTTILATSKSPSFVGETVTFTAHVSSTGGAIANGERVLFYDGTTFIGTGLTNAGVAKFSIATLSAKKRTMKATYVGDGTFKLSSGFVEQVVKRYPTTTTLISSLNPAIYGQPISYTVTVTSIGPQDPTGYVKVTNLGTLPLVNGKAIFTKEKLRAGTYAVTGQYLGDNNSAPSTSAVLQEVVDPASTSMALTSSLNPSSVGASVTFTATVTSCTGVAPYGQVTFTDGTITLGSVALSAAKARLSTAALAAGHHNIKATYSGAASFTGSSDSITQVVNP